MVHCVFGSEVLVNINYYVSHVWGIGICNDLYCTMGIWS